jgi:hypothetical protein
MYLFEGHQCQEISVDIFEVKATGPDLKNGPDRRQLPWLEKHLFEGNNNGIVPN